MSSTRYIAIRPSQPPFDNGMDPAGRIRYAFNVTGECTPNGRLFLEEIAKILQTAGIGTPGTDIFAGSVARSPKVGPGPYLFLFDTGGAPSARTQTSGDADRPAALIEARAEDLIDARDKAWDAYEALDAVTNLTVTIP